MTNQEKIQKAREKTSNITGFYPEEIGYTYAHPRKKDVAFAASEKTYKKFHRIHKWKIILTIVSIIYLIFLIPMVFGNLLSGFLPFWAVAAYLGVGLLLQIVNTWFRSYSYRWQKKNEDKIVILDLE